MKEGATATADRPTAVPPALFWSWSLLLLLPVWVPRYLLTEDGLAHLYWVEMYRTLADPGAAAGRLFVRNVALDTPHQQLYFWLQYGLGALLEPHLAQKVIVSLAVLSWAGAIWLLSRAVSGHLSLGALAALLLVHSSWLYNGFFAFVGALPIVLVELAVLVRLTNGTLRGDRPGPYLVLATLGMLAHYAHFFVGALFLMLGGLWLVFPWRPLRFRRQALAAALLPIGGLIAWYFARGTLGSGGAQWEPFPRAIARFFGLAFFRGFAAPAGSYFPALAGFAVVLALLLWHGLRDRPFRELSQTQRFIFLLAALLAASYFAAPVAIGEAYPFNGRLQYAGLAWLLPSLPSRFAPRARLAILAAVSLLLAWQVTVFTGRAVRLSRDYELVLRQAQAIPAGSTIASSLAYDRAAYDGSFIRVLATVPEDIALRRRALMVGSFFSALPFYWVRERSGAAGVPDYTIDLRPGRGGRIDLLIRRP